MPRARTAGPLLVVAALALRAPAGASDQAAVKVGVLHSLNGTMAISERAVMDATLLALDEIDAAGGVLGRRVVPIHESGDSDPAIFRAKAKKLLEVNRVATVFGGWTSASRVAMKPVFEEDRGLLFYPVQFEGNECSPNIVYSGAQPNQQLLPALEWALKKGYRRIFLVGSQYIFPETANYIIKKHAAAEKARIVGEQYVQLGATDFTAVIAALKATAPQLVLNTINGDSNVAFFRALDAAGLGAARLPVLSFSIAEQEAQRIGPRLLEGHYAAWNYFQSLDVDANRKFVAAFKQRYGADSVVTDPMAHGYLDVYAWKAAVEKSGSFDPAAVRKALVGLELDSPLGKVKFDGNQSLYQHFYVGQATGDGQFKIVAASKEWLKPEPYDPLAFPQKACTPR
jgi:urea transport system substrate-binding protein